MGTIDDFRQARPSLRLRGLFYVVHHTVAYAVARLEKRRSRKALLEMSEWQLKDIGVTREDAEREAVRRFWM